MRVLVFKDIKNKRYTLWNESKTKHLGYRKQLSLINAKFIVIESKRKTVLKTKKRFPHAWVIGDLIKINPLKNKEVKYNPFQNSHFMKKGKPILKAKSVFFKSNGKLFV
jgi:hypothetical protein